MEPQTVDIKDISKLVIYYLNNNGISVTPLKLQKLLYYIQAWHLVFFDKHPFFEDKPEAWVNGPVYTAVYDEYKSQKMKNEAITLEIPEGKSSQAMADECFQKIGMDAEQQKYLNAVLKKYGFMASEKLVMLTHTEKPWNDAREGLRITEKGNNYITHESMYNYYSSRGKK